MEEKKTKKATTKKVKIERVNSATVSKERLENALDFITNLDYSTFGLSSFNTATQSSYSREEQYNIIDIMGQDDRNKAVLDVYSQYICNKNENGDSVWCESSNQAVQAYVTCLLKELNVNKNIYSWTYSLLKYGDLYLKLSKDTPKSRILNEAVKLDDNIRNFNYTHSVEAVQNPGEMYELQKNGKTACFIKLPESSLTSSKSSFMHNTISYSLKSNDTVIYSSTDFVHISLKSNVERAKEEMEISLNNSDKKEVYTINSGESLLLPSYKVWRQLQLLENSALLDEVVRSSVVRFIEIDGGDMPKEQVQNFVSRLKQTIEQKAALNVNANFNNYTEPSPIQNIVYTVKHGSQGSISTTTLGGDTNTHDLLNLDWWNNRYYGSFGIPKQYFGWTNDSTGFNGGSSLSIISSVFGRSIPLKQTAIIEGLTTLVNIILLSEGKIDYVNEFSLKMLPPTTQESADRKEEIKSKLDVAQQLFGLIEPYITDDSVKLKMINSLIPQDAKTSEFSELVNDYISGFIDSAEDSDELEDEKDSEEREMSKFEI